MAVPAGKWPQLYDSAFTTRKAVLDQAYNVVITEQIIDDGGSSNPQGTAGGTGQLVLDFEMPAKDPKALLVQNEMSILINYPAAVGGQTQDVFTIRSIETGTASGSPIFRVHAEARWYELGTDEPIVVNPAVTDPTSALNTMLAGSGWTIGSVSSSISGGPTRSFQIITRSSPLAAVRSLPSVFGGEVVFDTVLRQVSLLVKRGSSGVVALYARSNNVAEDSRVIDTSQMVTRLYPLGASNLDITTVNGGVGYVENYSWFDSQIPAWPHVIKSANSTNSALSDPNLLKSWGQQQVAMLGLPRVTYSVSPVLMQTDIVPGLGDTVRVWDKTIALDASARIVNRTLDLLQPQNTKLQINTSAFMLSNALPGTPTGTVVPVANLDVLAPAAPTGIVVTSTDVIDGNGSHIEYLNFSWNPVTTNSDSSPITDLDHYEVQYRNGTGFWISAGTTPTTAMQSGPMPPGRAFSVQVRAVDRSYNASTWTIFNGTTPGIPVSTLNPPSGAALDVATFPLTVRAIWDGKDSGTMAYPNNFDHIEVHTSTVSGFTPSTSTQVDTMASAGVSPITGRTAGTTYYVKLVAVDTAGFKSNPSVQTSAIPTAVQDGQIVSLSISKLLVGSLTADLTVASRIKTADTGARVEISAGGLFAYNASNVQTFALSSVDGSATATGGTFTGATIIGGMIKTAASGKRFEISSGTSNSIKAYSGQVTEAQPAQLTVNDNGSDNASIGISGANKGLTSANGLGQISLQTVGNGPTGVIIGQLLADQGTVGSVLAAAGGINWDSSSSTIGGNVTISKTLAVTNLTTLNGGANTYGTVNLYSAALNCYGTSYFSSTMQINGGVTAPYFAQSGSFSLGYTAASGGGLTGTVYFGSTFPRVPGVSLITNSSRLTCSINNITTSSFGWSINDWTAASTTGMIATWTAIAA